MHVLVIWGLAVEFNNGGPTGGRGLLGSIRCGCVGCHGDMMLIRDRRGKWFYKV